MLSKVFREVPDLSENRSQTATQGQRTHTSFWSEKPEGKYKRDWRGPVGRAMNQSSVITWSTEAWYQGKATSKAGQPTENPFP